MANPATLDERISSLTPEIDEKIRHDLQNLLRVLRDVGYPAGVLDIMMRLGLRLTSRLYEAAECIPPSDNLFNRIEDLTRQKLLPDEMASYFHLIRILSNKPHHDMEQVRLQTTDAENVLNGFLRVLEWFYCESERGPCLLTIYSVEAAAPLTAQATVTEMLQVFLRAQQATDEQVRRQQAELERLRAQQTATDQRRRELVRERVVGPVPSAVTEHFQDRVGELRSLREQLADDRRRLLLVCGRGGMGKTALITKLLHDVQQDFTLRLDAETYEVDSIVYAVLRQSEFRSPDKLIELICRTLESDAAAELRAKWQEQSSLGDKLEFLFRRTLSARRCLIVLDNFEDVLDDDNRIRDEFGDLRQFVEKCLEYDHGARLVATSRRTLVLTEELEGRIGARRWELPLDVGLPEGEAIVLLRELDSDGRLGLKAATDAMLRLVARRCHGIPRTLETLIGTLRQRRTMTLARLLEDEATFARLMDNPACELYENLSAAERLVIQVLAVYDRAVPAAAVRYLLPALLVDELLDALVRNYVVAYDRERFSLHPLDQQYAYRQLPEAEGEYARPSLHARAAEFFRALRKPQSEWKVINDLEPQLQEFHHLVCAGLYDLAGALLNQIDFDYLLLWGNAACIVEMRSQLADRLTDAQLQSWNWGSLGRANWHLGEGWKAVEYYRQALACAQAVTDRQLECAWLGRLGNVYRSLGELNEAVGYLEQAIQIAREVGDVRAEASCLSVRGNIHRNHRQFAPAWECIQQALQIARAEGDRRAEGNYLGNLGKLHQDVGEFQQAAKCYEQALELARQVGDRTNEAVWLGQLGDAMNAIGKPEQSEQYVRQALEQARALHDRRGQTRWLLKLGEAVSALRGFDAALAYYNEADAIATAINHRGSKAHSLYYLGEAHHHLGDLQIARHCYEEAIALNITSVTLSSTAHLGLALLEADNAEEARSWFARNMALCRKVLAESPRACDALYYLALAQLGSEQTAAAMASYGRALEVCAAKGFVTGALLDLRLLARAGQSIAGLAEAEALLQAAIAG